MISVIDANYKNNCSRCSLNFLRDLYEEYKTLLANMAE